MQATSRIWLKGQNNRVLKVSVLQQQGDSVTLFFPPLFNSTLASSSTATQDYCLHVRLQLFLWEDGVFVLERPGLSMVLKTNVCVWPLHPALAYSNFICNPGSGDATRRSLIAPLLVTPPSPLCQSVSVSPTHRRCHSLVVVRGGATSVGEMIPPVSLPQCWQRWEEHGPHRGSSSTPLSAAKVGAQTPLWIFTKLLLLKATRDTFVKKNPKKKHKQKTFFRAYFSVFHV